MRILIANRGEIARRIIRTAKRLGHETVAAWADPDADAPFVREATIQTRLGPAALAESYLSTDALLDAARRTGADAVHPGYGFVSENADFARAAIAAGLIWIGPKPEVIDQMGSKINARRLATSAGVPIIPGFDGDQDPTVLAEAARDIGYPVLVKAAAGGGGKGIRIVEDDAGFAPALAEAMAESMRSFGDDAMIVERYITQPRHVEVQIVGDKAGNVINLGTRECSVQRRYQKVLEEAPAPNLSDDTRAGLRSSATELARSIGYDSAGTVEFVVDAVTGDYFFLEMNTRSRSSTPSPKPSPVSIWSSSRSARQPANRWRSSRTMSFSPATRSRRASTLRTPTTTSHRTPASSPACRFRRVPAGTAASRRAARSAPTTTR